MLRYWTTVMGLLCRLESRVRVLFTFDRILLEDFCDAFVDRFLNQLGVSPQIGAGSSLQDFTYRAAKNHAVCFAIKQIDHQGPSRNVPHLRSGADHHAAVG